MICLESKFSNINPLCFSKKSRTIPTAVGMVSKKLGGDNKGVWWMPWQEEAMKDVAACDKPRGAGKQALIRGCPNGVTRSD